MAGHRGAPVLAGRHAPERPLRACAQLRAVRGRPRRHRRAAPGRAGHLGGRRALGPPAVRAEAVPAHRHLDVAILRVAPGRGGEGEGLRPAHRFQHPHHHRGRRGGRLHPVYAREHREPLGREGRGLLRPVRHLRCLRRRVRGARRPAYRGGPDTRGDGGPDDRRGAGAGRDGRAGVHHAHEEGASHDPLPHGRHRLRVHRHVRVRAHAGAHSRDRAQGRDVHRERRERVPHRHRVCGARAGGPDRRVFHPRVREGLHLQVRGVRGARAGQRRALRRGGEAHHGRHQGPRGRAPAEGYRV